MRYEVNFNIKKGYITIEVDADNKEDAENIAFRELDLLTIGELHKLEVDYDCDVAE